MKEVEIKWLLLLNNPENLRPLYKSKVSIMQAIHYMKDINKSKIGPNYQLHMDKIN